MRIAPRWRSLACTGLVALLAATGCRDTEHVTGPQDGRPNVLFIGNSLTYTNDLPGMVQAIARTIGVAIDVHALTLPNRAIVDYLDDGSARPLIAQGGWTHIVMQQGPTTLPICRDTLVLAVRTIDELGRRVGARSVVMMAWPTRSRPFDFPAVHYSAQMAAQTVGGGFAPVGDAWQLALAQDPTLEIYGDDGYHPGRVGTYLAALVIYEQVTGLDARLLPSEPERAALGLPLSQQTIIMLQQAAHEANANGFNQPVPAWTPSTPPNPPITC